VYVESVDGELVVTRLRDSALPLLRYRTGDRGRIDDGVCLCGQPRSIVGFAGREPCWLHRPDGERVDAWSLAWLFKDIPLARFRFVQRAARDFELVLADEPAIPAELLVERLRRALRRMGWDEVAIAVRRADLPSTGKPAPFVSLPA
jgi:phenylacetate-CoA ligase